MVFVIRKRDGEHELWLRSNFPVMKWGPREAAMSYPTRGLARRALNSLPAAQRGGCEIVEV